jgi:hypothetical protein
MLLCCEDVQLAEHIFHQKMHSPLIHSTHWLQGRHVADGVGAELYFLDKTNTAPPERQQR